MSNQCRLLLEREAHAERRRIQLSQTWRKYAGIGDLTFPLDGVPIQTARIKQTLGVVSAHDREQEAADLLVSLARAYAGQRGADASEVVIQAVGKKLFGRPTDLARSVTGHVILLMFEDPTIVNRLRSGEGLSNGQRNSLTNLARGYSIDLPDDFVDLIAEELMSTYRAALTQDTATD